MSIHHDRVRALRLALRAMSHTWPGVDRNADDKKLITDMLHHEARLMQRTRPEEPMMHQDSVGRPIKVGDRVRWRGDEYTIKAFGEPGGAFGAPLLEFEEALKFHGVPDETQVDLIERLCGTRVPGRIVSSDTCVLPDGHDGDHWCNDGMYP